MLIYSFFTFSLNILLLGLCLMLGSSNSKWSQVLCEDSGVESFLTGFYLSSTGRLGCKETHLLSAKDCALGTRAEGL